MYCMRAFQISQAKRYPPLTNLSIIADFSCNVRTYNYSGAGRPMWFTTILTYFWSRAILIGQLFHKCTFLSRWLFLSYDDICAPCAELILSRVRLLSQRTNFFPSRTNHFRYIANSAIKRADLFCNTRGHTREVGRQIKFIGTPHSRGPRMDLFWSLHR
jgi:hypothetical protein